MESSGVLTANDFIKNAKNVPKYGQGFHARHTRNVMPKQLPRMAGPQCWFPRSYYLLRFRQAICIWMRCQKAKTAYTL